VKGKGDTGANIGCKGSAGGRNGTSFRQRELIGEDGPLKKNDFTKLRSGHLEFTSRYLPCARGRAGGRLHPNLLGGKKAQMLQDTTDGHMNRGKKGVKGAEEQGEPRRGPAVCYSGGE